MTGQSVDHLPLQGLAADSTTAPQDSRPADPPPTPFHASYLYTSHFLSTWNFRWFEFGSVLFLARIWTGTLLPLSIYALVRATSAILLAPATGRYIDRAPRLRVVRNSIVWQRAAVILSCGLLWTMLALKASIPPWTTWLLFGLTTLLACVEKSCTIINTVAIERDWVVVMARDDERLLSHMNATMRRIDLFCKLVGPLAIGLLDSLSTEVAILTTLAINCISVAIEYLFIANVYISVPTLAHRPHVPTSTPTPPPTPAPTNPLTPLLTTLSPLLHDLHLYATQPACRPSLALSMLYLTVLSFSGQMITYLLSAGYTALHVSLLRLVSTAFELSATFAAPRLMHRIGPVRAGLWFLNLQMLCLAPAVAGFWLAGTPAWAAACLVGGTVVSRVGLWGFDLSAQVLIQEEVAPECRGAFSTTEAALQNFFELVAYALTIGFSRPAQFGWPATVSVCAVFGAGAVYASFVRNRRGHIFHASACLKNRHKDGGSYTRVDAA